MTQAGCLWQNGQIFMPVYSVQMRTTRHRATKGGEMEGNHNEFRVLPAFASCRVKGVSSWHKEMALQSMGFARAISRQWRQMWVKFVASGLGTCRNQAAPVLPIPDERVLKHYGLGLELCATSTVCFESAEYEWTARESAFRSSQEKNVKEEDDKRIDVAVMTE
ncbi:hypothetical protein B0H19DRAFT_1058388 [Mycena capillaripes]|nr:hypothetical protein B0H19DRAFT_1058388 [Mycena capillaripes]